MSAFQPPNSFGFGFNPYQINYVPDFRSRRRRHRQQQSSSDSEQLELEDRRRHK
jgi:hypothetical protein